MKILMIAPTPFFSHRGTHIRIFEEARALEARGHEIKILTYHVGDDIHKYVETDIDVRRIRRWLFWYQKTAAGGGGDWQKVILDLFLIRKVLWMTFFWKPDVIHGHLHEGVIIGRITQLLFFWRRSLRLVADFHGSLVGEMRSHGYFKESLVTRFFKYIEYRISRMGNAAIVSSADNVDKIRDARTDRLAYHIFDGVDLANYGSLHTEKRQLRDKYGIAEEKTVIVYTGGLVHNKGVQNILDAAAHLAEDRHAKDLHFVIGGDAGGWVEKFVEVKNLQNIFTVIYPLNYFNLPQINALADIAIDPKNMQSKQASGKILQYGAAHTAIICADRKTNRAYIGEAGIYIEKLTARSLADKILNVANDSSMQRKKASDAYKASIPMNFLNKKRTKQQKETPQLHAFHNMRHDVSVEARARNPVRPIKRRKAKTPMRQALGYTFTGVKVFFDLGLLVMLSFLIIFFYTYYNTVDASELTKRRVSETSVIYDRTGEHVLYRLYGEENRKLVSHDQLPDVLRNATVAIEDERFYNHFGIDFIGIARAIRVNLEAGGAAEGASTLTQQVARNALLTREKTIVRKFKEAVLAVKIERTYTKEEILDLYLNLVPYGSNTYGAEVAAQTYFGKSAIDLTLDEAAMIASIPKATTKFSPYAGDSDALRARIQTVLRKTGALDMYTADEVNAALREDTLKKVLPLREEIDAPHFVFYVREELEKIYGRERLERGGLKIYTTLDFDMQNRAQKMVTEYGVELPRYGASNASLVAIDPKTGEVLAMVGSVDYFDRENDGNVNVALMDRQPGSSFKPLVYTAAFEKGYQPETKLYDVTTSFGPDGTGKEYEPDNFDSKKYGLVDIRKAVQGSLNIPAVKTQYLVGTEDTIDFAESLGITTLTDRNRYGLSLVLGGGEVKLLELVGAYSVFANDGVRLPAHGIMRIVGPEEETILTPEPERVVSEQSARKINSILSDYKAREYVFGRTNVLSIPDRTVAAKTGTTQSFRDALTIGYTPSLAVGVWAGNNDATFMNDESLGSRVAAPLWRQFIESEIADTDDEPFPEYEVVESDLYMLAGKVPPATGGTKTYYKIASGKKISESRARNSYGFDPEVVRTETTGASRGHSLLYYVNRTDPLDDQVSPDYASSMLWRWEKSLGHSKSVPKWSPPKKESE